jgi:hypothetical protein
MSKKITIVGLLISDRVKNASEIQKVFTEYGCHIKTRLGIHEASKDVCAPGGLVILEVVGDDNKISEMVSKLKKVTDVQVSTMTFNK